LRPPEALARLVGRAAEVLDLAEREPHSAPAGLAAELERVAGLEATLTADAAEMRELAGRLREYFRGASPEGSGNDGFCFAEVTDFGLRCYLTVFPPRRGGRQISAEECFRELDALRVTLGLDESRVRAAVAEVQAGGDVVPWVLVAEGRAPTEPRRAQLELVVPHVTKSDLRLDARWLREHLPECLRELKEGEVVGRYRPPAAGEPGTSVRGKPIPARSPGELAVELGSGLKGRYSASGEIHAISPGQLVLDARRLEVMPLFLVEGDLAPDAPAIDFRGLVVVLGNLCGQKVDADEVIVAGNCERSEVRSAGDVFVGGGVIGKKEGRIFADGRVAARHVSDAEVEALGEIIVTNTITYSEVTSNGRVIVTAERGSIVGGRVAALRGIEARSVGSDFGTYTVTAVGRDFLTGRRLERLREVIALHEDNLEKIDALKSKLARHRVDVKKLPPAKQDIYLGVLRKEARSRQELEGLIRRRDRLSRVLSDVLEATIRIREELYPPVRVEIADAIREIEERLRRVVVFRDGDRGIVTRADEGV
jgi:uncharacterized protein (DUF342 family)